MRIDPELERRLEAACPDFPRPTAEATARALTAIVTAPAPRRARPSLPSWLGRRPLRLLLVGAVLAGGGGALAATLLERGAPAPQAPAPHELAWGEPATLSRPFEAFGLPAVAVGADGRAAAAWSRDGRVEGRIKPLGAGWGQTAALSRPGVIATAPQIALDGHGNAIAVWREQRPGRRLVVRFRFPSGRPAGVFRVIAFPRWLVVARVRPRGGGWQPPVDLSLPSPNRRDAADPQIGMSADGTAIAVWGRADRIETRVWRAGGGWGAVDSLGAGGIVEEPQLSVTPSGAAALVWSSRTLGGPVGRAYVVRAALRPAGGAWRAPAALSAPLVNPPRARIAVDERLRAAAIWSDYPVSRAGPAGTTALAIAVRAPGGPWSAGHPMGLPISGPGQFAAAVGVDGNGTTLALWSRGPFLFSATMSAGGTWSGPRRLARAAGALVAPEGAGGLVAVLVDRSGLEARIWRPGMGFARARRVARAPSAYALALASSRGGTTIAAWLSYLPARGYVVRAALRQPPLAAGGAKAGS